MTVWRPQQGVQVKAIGLVWRDGLLLASEVTNDTGVIKGVRPLGGRIEFGETWREALVREFDEELNVAVTLQGPPIVLENIYTHQGVVGHEVIFVSTVVLPEDAYPGTHPITFLGSGSIFPIPSALISRNISGLGRAGHSCSTVKRR